MAQHAAAAAAKLLQSCPTLCDPVGNLISGSSAFSKSILYIWKFLVHVLLKPSLKDFEHTRVVLRGADSQLGLRFVPFPDPSSSGDEVHFPAQPPLANAVCRRLR